MSQKLTLNIPDELYQTLQTEAQNEGKSIEQVTFERLAVEPRPPRGSVERIMPFFGAWQMTPTERASIEHMIEEERLREEEDL